MWRILIGSPFTFICLKGGKEPCHRRMETTGHSHRSLRKENRQDVEPTREQPASRRHGQEPNGSSLMPRLRHAKRKRSKPSLVRCRKGRRHGKICRPAVERLPH